MSMFPMYIAVCHEPSSERHGYSQSQSQGQEPKFNLYQNTIYDSATSAARHNSPPINVLWPMPHIKGKRQTIRLTDTTTEHSSLSRSWNGTELNSIKWSFTGSSVYVLLERYNLLITAPIVFMDAANKRMLPYNSNSFSPNEIKFMEEEEMSYTPARVFRTDPNSPENTSPIPGMSQDRSILRSAAPAAPVIPIAPLVPEAVSLAPLVIQKSAKQPTLASLPPHITKIVLADSIRKNEVCPITSEDISETNATVTPCGHVFTTAAIAHWLSLPSSKGQCPVCKQKCS